MKLNSHKAPSITEIKNQFVGALLYGPNQGFLANFLKNFKETFKNDNLIQISNDEVKKRPNIIIESLYSIDIFNPNNNLVIVNYQLGIDKVIEQFLQNPIKEAFLIIVAEELKPQNKMRTRFENASNLVSMAFYEDNIADIKHFIKNTFISMDKNITPDALEYIANNTNKHRELLKREIERIVIYMGKEAELDITHAQKALFGDLEANMEHIINLIFNKEINTVYKQVNNNITNMDDLLFIRKMMAHIKKLLEIKSKAQNDTIMNVINTLKPPVFFMQKEQLAKQANLWSMDKLINTFINLNQLEIKSKTYPEISGLLVLQTVLALAK